MSGVRGHLTRRHWIGLTGVAFGAGVLSIVTATPAQARCDVAGNTVICSGASFEGFYAPDNALNVTVNAFATVQNVASRNFFGNCQDPEDDLSLPAIQVGARSTVTNNGTVAGVGVCGWGIGTGNQSSVFNNGFITTNDDLGFGIRVGGASVIQNAGAIQTLGFSAPGILAGASANAVNLSGGQIHTFQSGSSAIQVGDGATVTNAGVLTADADLSYGIEAASGARLENRGKIVTAGKGGRGMSFTGGIASITNSGSITALADGQASPSLGAAAIKGDGMDISVVNSGTAIGSYSGIDLTPTRSVTVSNTGMIVATGSQPLPPGALFGPPAAVRVNGSSATTLQLTNDGQITGAVSAEAITASSGRLSIANTGTIAGSIAGVHIKTTQFLTVDNSGSITATAGCDRAVAACGAIVVESNTNSTIGLVNSGRLIGTAGAAAVLASGDSISLTNSGSIQGDILLQLNNAPGDSVRLSNRGSIHGNILLRGGTGTIDFLDGSEVVGNVDGGGGGNALNLFGAGSLSGSTSNLGYLIKSGAGLWALNGDANIGTQLNVIQGELLLDHATVRAPQINIVNQARLSGSGVIVGAVSNSGTLAPGLTAVPGTLEIDGAYNQTSDGALNLRLWPSGPSDQIVMNGIARLSGVLAIDLSQELTATARFRDGQVIPAIVPQGIGSQVLGAFSEVHATSSAFLKPTLLSSPTTGLSIRIQRLPYASAATTANEMSVAGVVDRFQDAAPLAKVVRALDFASLADARSTFDNLAPQIAPIAPGVAMAALKGIDGVLRDETLQFPANTGSYAWGSYFYRSGGSGGTAPEQTYDFQTQGVSAGMARSIGSDLTLGFALARTHSGVDLSAFSGNARENQTTASALVVTKQSNIIVSGIATVGGLTVSSARTQTLAGADRALTSRTHGNVFSAQADASMEQESGPIVFRPRVGVAYNAVHLGALDEGLDLGIRTNPSTLQSLTSTVGLRVEVSANPIRGFGELAWSQELLDVDRTASASLVGLSQQTFTIVGERAKRAVLMLRGGVSYAVRPAVSVEVSAGGSPNDPLNGFACNVAVRWHWGT